MPSRVVCFVCGSLGGEFGQLHTKHPGGGRVETTTPFFPFLEHHDPPQGCRQTQADGLVDSCVVCHSFLTQQWANYERTKTPVVKRLYWLKRLDDGQFTGAEMKLQGEYMAQVMGLQYQPDVDGYGLKPQSPEPAPARERSKVGGREGAEVTRKKRVVEGRSERESSGGVLDLSVSVKSEHSVDKLSKRSSKETFSSKPTREDTGSVVKLVKDLNKDKVSVKPELDEYSFVCYTCGADNNGVAPKFVSSCMHAPGEPYFPFLARLPPCKGAAPLTAQGVCRVCELCFSSLCHQWLAYEQHGTPSGARVFRLGNLFLNNEANPGLSDDPDKRKLKQEVEEDSNFQAFSESKRLKEKYQPEDARRSSSLPRNGHGDPLPEKSAIREVCYLCSNIFASSSMSPLFTTPSRPSVANSDERMYFPFIRELRRPQGAHPLNPDGSVRACLSCIDSLSSQWRRFEKKCVPVINRDYSLLPHSTPINIPSVRPPSKDSLQSSKVEEAHRVHSNYNHPLHLDVGRHDMKLSASPGSKHAPASQHRASSPHHSDPTHPHTSPAQYLGSAHPYAAPPPALSGVPSDPTVLQGSTPEPRQGVGSNPASNPPSCSSTPATIPHPLQQAGERPKKVCFLCGEKCLSSHSQIINAYPSRYEIARNKQAGASSPHISHTFPFFPFVVAREPAPGADPIGEDGVVIACAYCYYSLLNQWRDYEEGSKGANLGEDTSDRWHRRYTLTEFACFVCSSLDVPRRSMRTLEVRKFGFLREHRAPPQALVMWAGESVACCKWCHYSLTHQLAEYERMGLPPELRKYNWTGRPQYLDENSCDTQDSTQDSQGPSHSEPTLNIASEAGDSNQGAPGAPSTKHLPASLGGPHTPGMGTKLPPKTATVSPLNHYGTHPAISTNTSGGSGTNMRTSGFAAALRKLAHQAKDSTDEPGGKHSSSPPDRHSPRDLSSKGRVQGSSSQLNFPTWPPTSAPVVTIAPTQTLPSQPFLHLDAHRNIERSTAPSTSRGSVPSPYDSHHASHQKIDGREHYSRQTPPSAQSRDREDDGRRSRSSSRITPHTSATSPPSSNITSQAAFTSQAAALDLYARSLHGYRPAEEEALRLGLTAGLPPPYGLDPATYAMYAAAAYHPAVLQQQAALAAAHSSYRLDDPLLLERYRLMQASSSYLPFHGLAGLPPLPGIHPAQFPGGAVPHELLQYSMALGAATPGHPLLDPLLVGDPRLAASLIERSHRAQQDKPPDLRDKEDHRLRESQRRETESEVREKREPGERLSTHNIPDTALSSREHSRHDPNINGDDHRMREVHRQSENMREGHPKASKLDQYKGSSTRPYHGNATIIKPYDKEVDLKLSQESESSSQSRVIPPFQPPPLVQRPWMSATSHQPIPTSAATARKDFFRPFDDNFGKTKTEDTANRRDSSPTRPYGSYPHQGETTPSKDKHLSSPSVRSHGWNHLDKISDSRKGNILSIPSVNIPPHQPSRSPPPLASMSSLPQHSLPSSASSSVAGLPLVPGTLLPQRTPPSGPPPPLVPALHHSAEVVAVATQPSNKHPGEDEAQPAISRFISNRIERFDFKSLARECTTTPTTPGSKAGKRARSKLDSREAALKVTKKRRCDLDKDIPAHQPEGEKCVGEEEERLHSRLTMLGQASLIPPDSDETKLDLLEYLDLTTHNSRRDLEIKIERARRRRLRQASLSPARGNLDWTGSFVTSSHYHGLEARQRPSLKEEPSRAKVAFLGRLNLRRVVLEEKAGHVQRCKLLARYRTFNQLKRFTPHKQKRKAGKAPASSQQTSTTRSAADSQHHHHLISAGLVTEVRPILLAEKKESNPAHLSQKLETITCNTAGLSSETGSGSIVSEHSLDSSVSPGVHYPVRGAGVLPTGPYRLSPAMHPGA